MYDWTVLNAGRFRLDGGSMFGVVPKALWARMVEPDDANRIPLQTNCVLLDDGSTRVLIETGYGGKWSAKERKIFALEERTVLDALGEADVDPATIDVVIVTHLHFDHAGGLTHLDRRDEPMSSFPNARIVVQRQEWEDALANKSTMTKTYLRSHLDPVRDQVRVVEDDTEVAPGVTVWPMPGHTWGQQAVRFETGDGVVCFPGDVLPTINHVGAAFNMGYDMLPYRNMLSKQALLAQAEAEGWRMVLDHDPATPVVRVVRDDAGRFELTPVEQ